MISKRMRLHGVRHATLVRLALALMLGQCLASCGGGGGGGSSAPPPPPPAIYSISGTVNGLQGSGATLVDSRAGSTFVTANGAFTLPTDLPNGATYDVTVSSQPLSPNQTCTVVNGSGTVQSASVSGIVVNCVTNTYPVSGTASGINGTTVAVQLNGGSTIMLTANGSFSFTDPLPSGTAYAVTVSGLPTDTLCTVQNGTGTIVASAVSNITVNCSPDQSTFSSAVSNVVATDVAWEPHRNLLYVAMSSLSSVAPNAVLAFDPVSGAVTNSGFIGSEPASISPSDDGAYLYVGFSACQQAQRLELPSLSPDMQFSTVVFDGNGGAYSGSPMYSLQVAAAPGLSGTFGLLTVFTQGLSGTGSIIVYDSSTPRWGLGLGGSGAPSANAFAWGADAATLLSIIRNAPGDAANFLLYGIGPTTWGIATEADSVPFLENGLSFAGGLVYGDSGKVLDPRSGLIEGGYLPDNDSSIVDTAIAPDIATGRVFIALDDMYESVSVLSFNLSTFAPISTAAIPVRGRVKKIIRWGVDGLALILKDGRLILINGPFVAPGGSATAASIPGATTNPVLAFTPAQVFAPVAAADIAADPTHNRVFASIPATSAIHPQSIATLDPVSGAVLGYTDLTINPGVVAVSGDGHYLYVAASDSPVIQRWILPQMTLDIPIPLGAAPQFADDVVVAPGSPNTIVVALQNPEFVPPTGPIQVFDDAVARQTSIPYQGDWADWGAAGTNLYTFENQSSGFTMRQYAVGLNDATLSNATPQSLSSRASFPFPFSTKFKVAGEIAYGETGVVWNPATRGIDGTFAVTSPAPVVVDLTVHRAYFATPGVIEAFDSLHYTVALYATVNSTNTVTRLVQMGPGAFALRTTAGEVVLLNDPRLGM